MHLFFTKLHGNIRFRSKYDFLVVPCVFFFFSGMNNIVWEAMSQRNALVILHYILYSSIVALSGLRVHNKNTTQEVRRNPEGHSLVQCQIRQDHS